MTLSPSHLLTLTALVAVAAAPAQTRAGVDVLAADGCAALRGRKVGLITNHTGRTADGRRTVDVIAESDATELKALFSPEHGWQGVLDERVGDTVDAPTGLKVFSLYGETRRPSAEMLAGLDTLVFDVQDIGCRFYTYIATMRNGLEAAAEHGLRFDLQCAPAQLPAAAALLARGPRPILTRRRRRGWTESSEHAVAATYGA